MSGVSLRRRASSAPASILRSIAMVAVASAVSVRDGVLAANAGAFDFEYTGCARVRPGPLCEVQDGAELTFWSPGTAQLMVDAARATAKNTRESSFVEGGHRVIFQVPKGTTVVRLRAGEEQAELRLAENSEPPPLAELARSWKAGRWEQVRTLLDQTALRLPGAERTRTRAFRARLALRAGDDERAAAELEQTAESARKAGLLLEASTDLFAAAYCRAVRLGQYERSRALLESAEGDLARVPETRARLAYYTGVLAKSMGDAQGALVQFRKARVLSRRLGLVSDELQARHELAATLNQLHRHAEALAEQEALVARAVDAPSCLLSLGWENLAWILLTQADPSLQQRAAVALDRAEQLFERCPDPRSRRNQVLSRVELALLRGDAGDAKARLRALDADTTGRSTRLAAWQAQYWGELHLLEGDIEEALNAFDLAHQFAESVGLEDCVYLSRLGRARALSRRKDREAIGAYLAAEDAADELVRWAPFGQGQQLTALQVQESSRELLSLLLSQDEIARAYAVAIRSARRMWASSWRASRIAALRGSLKLRWERAVAEYRARRQDLERAARDDWKLSLEALAAVRLSRALEVQRLENALAEAYALIPSDGIRSPEGGGTDDAHLLLSPGKDGWWAFLCLGDRLEVALVARFSPGEVLRPTPARLRDLEQGLAAALEGFERQGLLGAHVLRVTMPPELAALDVHALEFGDSVIAERLPVAYTFEPGGPSEQSEADERSSIALVLGDPSTDLPWAESEALRVASRFPGARALFRGQVTFDAVARQLPDTRLLHFAGHASSGGIDGMDGALRLSSDQRFSLADVLALRRVPEFVVLSSCASSVSPEPGGGLSIGQAFLAGGSRAVVGASRSIADTVAQRFVQALYDRLLGSATAPTLPRDSRVWARAVRDAALDVRRADRTADWASIRLLLP